MSSETDDQLNWLAMQYVLGELSESDSEAFEERLVDDLAACEAVARASRMSRVLRAALDESTTNIQVSLKPSATFHRSRLALGTALTAVVCLFAVTAFSLPRNSDHTAIELVSRWQAGTNTTEMDSEDPDDEPQEANTDSVVPDWLLAGIVLEKGGVVDGPVDETKDN